jgi:hypothetical protein
VKFFVALCRADHRFVAAQILRNLIQSLQDPPTQVLATLPVTHQEIFDMSDEAHVMGKLPLYYQCARTDNPVLAVRDDQDNVRVAPAAQILTSSVPFVPRDDPYVL